jgi:hypothetical protein
MPRWQTPPPRCVAFTVTGTGNGCRLPEILCLCCISGAKRVAEEFKATDGVDHGADVIEQSAGLKGQSDAAVDSCGRPSLPRTRRCVNAHRRCLSRHLDRAGARKEDCSHSEHRTRLSRAGGSMCM